MIEKLLPVVHHSEETLRRSIVKTLSYRVVIMPFNFNSIKQSILKCYSVINLYPTPFNVNILFWLLPKYLRMRLM